jgi:DNA-binding NtrC family response regulator
MAPIIQQPIYHKTTDEPTMVHRVLVLDDEPAILFAYRKIIENEGLHVDVSTCLSDAVNFIQTHRYLAVVADVRLSGSENQDGLDFLRILRTSHPATKMILATGHGTSEIRNTARSLGVEHVFVKPVQPASIIDALKGFLYMPAKATS